MAGVFVSLLFIFSYLSSVQCAGTCAGTINFYKLCDGDPFDTSYCQGGWSCYWPLEVTQDPSNSLKYKCNIPAMDNKLDKASQFYHFFAQVRWYEMYGETNADKILMWTAQITVDGNYKKNYASDEYAGRVHGSEFSHFTQLSKSHELTFNTGKKDVKFFCTVNYAFYSKKLDNNKIQDMANYYKWYVGRSTNFTVTDMAFPNYTLISMGNWIDSEDRALNGQQFTSDDMTIEKCLKFCIDKGYVYAGVQNGRECRCGDCNFDRYGPDLHNSYTRCAGDNTQPCGNSFVNHVFTIRLAAPVQYLGCFVQFVFGRKIHQSGMTVDKCVRICTMGGFAYAGISCQHNCICTSFDYDKYGPADPRYPCIRSIGEGDPTRLCHSSFAVYTIAPVEPDYRGCWKDKHPPNPVPHPILTSDSDKASMTISKCKYQCRLERFKYAALSNGSACSCGNELYNVHGISTTACDNPCTGDATRTCGGQLALQVYAVGETTVLESDFRGCWEDAPWNRAMKEYFFSNKKIMTVDYCKGLCAEKGYMHAGLKTGYWCYCSNGGYDKHGISSECTVPCVGNTSETCGGETALQVYVVRPTLQLFVHVPEETVGIIDSYYFRIPCNFTTSNGIELKQYEVRWYAVTGDRAQNILTYDALTGEEKKRHGVNWMRYGWDNSTLRITKFRESDTGIKCCEIYAPWDPPPMQFAAPRYVSAAKCTRVTSIVQSNIRPENYLSNFAKPGLTCYENLLGVKVNREARWSKDSVDFGCSYIGFSHRHSLEVWYGDRLRRDSWKLSYKPFWEADRNSDGSYDMTINVTATVGLAGCFLFKIIAKEESTRVTTAFMRLAYCNDLDIRHPQPCNDLEQVEAACTRGGVCAAMLQQNFQAGPDRSKKRAVMCECPPGWIGFRCENEDIDARHIFRNVALKKPAYQSSVDRYKNARYAVDGNKDGDFSHGSCFKTYKMRFQWWAVDLGALHYVEAIALTNANLGGSEARLKLAVMGFVPSHPLAVTPTSRLLLKDVCKENPQVGENDTVSFSCRSVGRYFVIYIDTWAYLSLCEVELFGYPVEDLALQQSVYQSSTVQPHGPERAVDGNTSVLSNTQAYCARTKAEQNAWWALDLGNRQWVDLVSVTLNTTHVIDPRDTRPSLQVGITSLPSSIQAFNTLSYVQNICARQNRLSNGVYTAHYKCAGQGKYLYIVQKGHGELQLCHVNVYGYPYVNVATNKPTFQSSMMGNNVAIRAVDGLVDDQSVHGASCSETSPETNPWWAVDLGHGHWIDVVELTSAQDGPPPSNIRIATTHISPAETVPGLHNLYLCGSHDKEMRYDEPQTIACGRMGRYLVVLLETTISLALCEVKVYAVPVGNTDVPEKQTCTDSETAQTDCVNGGTCFAIVQKAHRTQGCSCLFNYEGKNCEFLMDPDLRNPYRGCWKLLFGEFDPFGDGGLYSLAMTIDMCKAHCRKHGYRYAALQQRYLCHCDNGAYTKHGRANDCTVTCGGDVSQTCGNVFAIQVYLVGTEIPDTRLVNVKVKDDCEVAKTLGIKSCVFPFTYWGKTYDTCVPEKDQLWCSLYSAHQDGKWCYCQPTKPREFVYHGCWNYRQDDPIMQHMSQGVDNVNTNFNKHSCGIQCRDKGFAYMGMKNSRASTYDCYCSNGGYDKYGISNTCASKCPNDPDDTKSTCGGENAIDVYYVEYIVTMGKTAYQSTTGAQQPEQSSAVFAVDRVRSCDRLGISLYTLTHEIRNPWWAVDLAARHMIHSVTVTSSGLLTSGSFTECCAHNLHLLHVGTFYKDPQTPIPWIDSQSVADLLKMFVVQPYWPLNHCAQQDKYMALEETKTFKCSSVGQIVFIMLYGSTSLSLCEVEVYGVRAQNIALGKPTLQSSAHYNNDPAAAVDGNKNPVWIGGSCTHTVQETNPWWAVNLGSVYYVLEVAVTNRDILRERLSNIRIGVTDTNPTNYIQLFEIRDINVCNRKDGLILGTEFFPCGAHGTWVVIFNEVRNILTLCEVEVYGSAAPTNAYVDKCHEIYCENRGECVSLADTYDCLCEPGYWGKKCEWPTPAVRMSAPRHVIGYKGETVTLPCTYESGLSPVSDYTLRWYSYGQTHMQDILSFSPGRWNFKYPFSSNERYNLKNISLEISQFQKSDATIKCCDAHHWQLLEPAPVCMEVDYIDLPASAFSCYNLNISSPIQNDSTNIQGVSLYQQIIVNCSYSNAYPRHSLEVWYRNIEHAHMNKLATKFYWEATRTLENNLDNFDMTLEFTLEIRESTVFIVYAKEERTSLITRTFKFTMSIHVPEVNVALNKPTYQSSLFDDNVSGRAVDGNKNTDLKLGHSCTHTQANPKEWWAVDLENIYDISSVEITNRGDCCNERLKNFVIGTSLVNPQGRAPSAKIMKECAKQIEQLGSGETRKIECSSRGRYVIIQLQGTDFLTLCEVAVYGYRGTEVNVALHHPTYQSSLFNDNVSGRAVDGNKNTDLKLGHSCTHTQNNPKEWWAVDLENIYRIHAVEITNRGDCCNERLKNFVIGTSLMNPHERAPNVKIMRKCAKQIEPLGSGETRKIDCSSRGRYVIIQLLGTDFLQLCEVAVYAYKGAGEGYDDTCTTSDVSAAACVNGQCSVIMYDNGTRDAFCNCGDGHEGDRCESVSTGVSERNIVLARRAYQSSVYQDNVPGLAVDGNSDPNVTHGHCSHTQSESRPWWAVDMGFPYKVEFVSISNSMNAGVPAAVLKNFIIGTTNLNPENVAPSTDNMQVCAREEGALGVVGTKTYACGTSGRYLVVQRKDDDFLVLCEVAVLATPAIEIRPDKQNCTEAEKLKVGCVNESACYVIINRDRLRKIGCGCTREHPKCNIQNSRVVSSTNTEPDQVDKPARDSGGLEDDFGTDGTEVEYTGPGIGDSGEIGVGDSDDADGDEDGDPKVGAIPFISKSTQTLVLYVNAGIGGAVVLLAISVAIGVRLRYSKRGDDDDKLVNEEEGGETDGEAGETDGEAGVTEQEEGVKDEEAGVTGGGE